MAFDAGMLAAVAHELSLMAGARLEKISQPEKDELVFTLHNAGDSKRLSVSVSPNTSRINFTSQQKENPKVPPMFCTLLRKHLSSAKLASVEQPDFERVLYIRFSARDEMGFDCERIVIAEIMGKYSNLILCDGDFKILGVLRPVDFSTSTLRQVLCGMRYELPPSQNKINPLEICEADFISLANKHEGMSAEKWLLQSFCGISRLVAREIAFAYGGCVDAPVRADGTVRLWLSFSHVMNVVKNAEFSSVVIYNERHVPIEYAFLPIAQYGEGALVEQKASASGAIEDYFSQKEHNERLHQRAADIFRLIAAASQRLQRKIEAQSAELLECAKKDINKHYGDMITANLYKLRRGDETVSLIDYSAEDCPSVTLTLDTRLSPAQNAQRYYKLYNKAKRAEQELSLQIERARTELEYLRTVEESLQKAECEADFAEIRAELYQSGYASKMKNANPSSKKHVPKPLRFVSSGGYLILCGKNNIQNDYISTKLASKTDYWFHVKNMPGSHVVLVCTGKDEPDVRDFTEACEKAAYYSKARESEGVEVD